MRNMLILDGGYMTAIGKVVYPGFDIKKVKQLVERKFGPIARSHWFTSMNGEAQYGFHTWLKMETRMEVIVRGTKSKWCNECGHEIVVEKGIDVGMATDAIKFAHRNTYDRLIIANGDGDMVDAIKYIRDDLAKQVVIIGSEACTSADLMLNCDEFVDLMIEENLKATLKAA